MTGQQKLRSQAGCRGLQDSAAGLEQCAAVDMGPDDDFGAEDRQAGQAQAAQVRALRWTALERRQDRTLAGPVARRPRQARNRDGERTQRAR